MNKLYDTTTFKNGIGERSCFTTGSTSVLPSSSFTLMPFRFFLYSPLFITIDTPAWTEK